jgi:YVTN family beta-propeller protein
MRLIRLILVFLFTCTIFASGAFAAVKNIYVVNNSDNTVSVIDPVSKSVVATINVGSSPTGIAYNPANKKAYVVNRGDNTVTVIDTISHIASGTVNVGPYPWYVAVDPTTHLIDLNQWVKGLPVNYVYVTSPVSNSVTILVTTFDGLLSLPGGAIQTDLPPGIGAINVTLDTAEQKAYVVNCHNAIISALDLKEKKMAAKVEGLDNTDSFVGVGVDTGLKKVYAVSDKIDVMPVVDAGSMKVVAKVNVGKTSMNVTVDSSAHKAYVTNRGSNTVSVVDTKNDKVEATIQVGAEPVSAALADGRAYVTNCGSNSISVIDTATNKVVDTIPLPGTKPYRGLCPWGIAVF